MENWPCINVLPIENGDSQSYVGLPEYNEMNTPFWISLFPRSVLWHLIWTPSATNSQICPKIIKDKAWKISTNPCVCLQGTFRISWIISGNLDRTYTVLCGYTIQQNLQLQEAYWNPNIHQFIASSSFLLKALGSHFMKFLQRHAPCRLQRQCFAEMRRDDCQPNAGTHGTHLGQLCSDILMPRSIAANVDKQNGQIMPNIIYIYILDYYYSLLFDKVPIFW